MDRSHHQSRWIYLAALLAVLSVAAGLRLYRLPERPVGLHYDEAANGILAGEIARGLTRPIFIPSYTGKEVLFFYWTALWMKVSGVTPLALRLGAASMGIATIAAAAWAAHELLRDWPDAPWIALTAAAGLAVSFWHLILSRYGFRAISQPLLQAITVAALWRGMRLARHDKPSTRRMIWVAMAGLFCGLTAYTYLAARAFPLPLAAAWVTLLILDHRSREQRLAQFALFAAVAVLALAPLARYWLTHPGSFTTRARQVAAGSWTAAGSGFVACLRMFFLEGDPYVRFNAPGRPLFGPVVAGLFLLGLGTAVRRLIYLLRSSEGQARPRSAAALAFLLVSLPVMILPSALATDEITPSNLRTVGLLPFVYVFPALGLRSVVALARGLFGRRPRARALLFPAACLLFLLISGAGVAPGYLAWASSPALYYAADGDLAGIARYLNAADLSSTTPYVASQHYRHPTLAFLAEDYEAVRWLAGGRTLVFPPDGTALFLVPRSTSEHLDWVRSTLPAGALQEAPPGPDGDPAFHVYRSDGRQAPTPADRRDVNLGHVVRFLGHTVLNEPRAGETAEIAVWWRVTGSQDRPDYRPVARLEDRWGSVWGISQPFHYPSEQWAEGELVVDRLSIPVAPAAPPGEYVVQLGMYAPSADARLPVLDDAGAYAGLYTELPLNVARAATAPSIESLDMQTRLDAAVDGLTLLGTSLHTETARPGERLQATLFWQAGDTAPSPYDINVRLGETTLYQGAPVHGTYPFSAWSPGEIVADRYSPRLPLDTPPGKQPLAIEVGDETSLQLGEVTVQATDRTFEIPSISHPVTAILGDRVELLGYDLSSDAVAPGETFVLTVTWRALTEMMTDYTVFTHLRAPDGSMAGQRDQQPLAGSYPTSLWAPGEVVTDVYSIPVGTAANSGEHQLQVGMYVAETGVRLSVEDDDDNAVTLQGISVVE